MSVGLPVMPLSLRSSITTSSAASYARAGPGPARLALADGALADDEHADAEDLTSTPCILTRGSDARKKAFHARMFPP
jgi:hypothetical protein